MSLCFQKPEDEILSEYSSHWPTAIGKYVSFLLFSLLVLILLCVCMFV